MEVDLNVEPQMEKCRETFCLVESEYPSFKKEKNREITCHSKRQHHDLSHQLSALRAINGPKREPGDARHGSCMTDDRMMYLFIQVPRKAQPIPSQRGACCTTLNLWFTLKSVQEQSMKAMVRNFRSGLTCYAMMECKTSSSGRTEFVTLSEPPNGALAAAQYGGAPADGEATTEDTCLKVVFMAPTC